MSPRRKSRIYWKGGHAYADFRDFARWGGRLEALIPRNGRRATTDADEAMRLCAERLAELEEARRKHPEGPPECDPLERIAAFVGYYLAWLERKKRKGRPLSRNQLDSHKRNLTHATRFLASRDKHLLRDITPADIRAWLTELEVTPPPLLAPRTGGRIGPLSDNTRAKYLFSLNAMLRRAWREERIPQNPVDRLDPDEVPHPYNEVTEFLEIGEAALVLETARRRASSRRTTQHYVRLAVHLLTGARGNEVLGLEKADLDFIADQVWIRPNATRPNVNKARGTARVVPIWPQLRPILQEYLAGPHAPAGPRLFDPVEWWGWLNKIADDLGWQRKRVRRRVFRVTYASARVQTLDGGAPISDWTVQQEMGHASLDMLKEIYVRIGSIRQRREHVEYRWEEWADKFPPHIAGPPRGLSARWNLVLDALPATGATAREWQISAGVPVGTFYYIRDHLVKVGLVFRAGGGRGSRFYRADPGRDRDGREAPHGLALAG
jgi:integrase